MPAVATTVALVPFENLSGDPAQDVLARGFVEDIASALSRFGTVEVLYPRAVAADSPARGAILNALATTILRGSIRRAGDTIRITAQLLDAQGGRQLWADRFDVTADTLFSIQDEIAERVASALVMGVARTRLEAAQRAPLSTLETYDCWLRGLECLQRGTVEADAEARVFFERALETDPNFARAYAGLSLSWFNEWSCSRRAGEHLRRGRGAGVVYGGYVNQRAVHPGYRLAIHGPCPASTARRWMFRTSSPRCGPRGTGISSR